MSLARAETSLQVLEKYAIREKIELLIKSANKINTVGAPCHWLKEVISTVQISTVQRRTVLQGNFRVRNWHTTLGSWIALKVAS